MLGHLLLAWLLQGDSPLELNDLARMPSHWEREVTTCGVMSSLGANEREATLADGFRYSHVAIYVAREPVALPGEGAFVCLTGTYRRRDGLTVAEARARRLAWGGGDHGFVSPDNVFHPTRAFPAADLASTPLASLARDRSYWDRTTIVCGIIGDAAIADAEAILMSGRAGDDIAIHVAASSAALPAVGTEACLTGIYRRRDERMTDEAPVYGLAPDTQADRFPSDAYAFYPIHVEVQQPLAGPAGERGP